MKKYLLAQATFCVAIMLAGAALADHDIKPLPASQPPQQSAGALAWGDCGEAEGEPCCYDYATGFWCDADEGLYTHVTGLFTCVCESGA